MQRWVIHIDMDAFFASVEQLTRPTLRGRPVIVGGMNGRGVVAGASYEARKFGVSSAMPTYRALQLIGFGAVQIQPRKAVYSAASKRVFELIHQRVDLVEQLSIDEAFMEPAELIGATAAEVKDWADNLRAEIKDITGLPSSIGAGSGKQFAKIGSGQAKPDGSKIIPVDEELEFLHPLPVGKLWGVGPVTASKLQAIGVTTIGDLANMSEREVKISLGGTLGMDLWHLARGIDERPVAPRAEAKSHSAEQTFAKDLTTAAEVDEALGWAAESAHKRLLADGRGARTVTVKLKMADFRTETRSATLPYATDDAETLCAVAGTIVRYPAETGPVRLVGVGYSGLETARQDVLFPELDRAAQRQVAASASGGVSMEEPTMVTGIPGADGVVVPGAVEDAAAEQPSAPELPGSHWRATQDVFHPDFGHGWIQGSGHGVVSVRFETRATGPGKTRTFPADDSQLVPADPLDSLAWQDWLAEKLH